MTKFRDGTSLIGVPNYLVVDEIVLPGGPHDCVLDHVDTSHFEKNSIMDSYYKWDDMIGEIIRDAIIVDPRSRYSYFRLSPDEGEATADFLEALRLEDEPSVKKR